MQQREKIGAAWSSRQSAKKYEAAKLTFEKDLGVVLQIGKVTTRFHVAEEVQKDTKAMNRKGRNCSSRGEI